LMTPRMSGFNSKFGGGATIAMPRIRYLSAYANCVWGRLPCCYLIWTLHGIEVSDRSVFSNFLSVVMDNDSETK